MSIKCERCGYETNKQGIVQHRKLHEEYSKKRLEKLYWEKGNSLKDIAETYDKSVNSIKNAFEKLGIDTRSRDYPEWTDEELEKVKENYENVAKPKIMELLPRRTWAAIKKKAYKMSLKRKRRKNVSYPKPKEMTEFELGYLAGMIDGEGTITILYTRDEKETGPQLVPTIKISGTEKEHISEIGDWLGTDYSGSYPPYSLHQKEREKWSDCFVLEIRSIKGVLKILETVQDKLILKKEQAHLVKEFCQSRLENFGNPYSKREFEIKDKVRKLNERGP